MSILSIYFIPKPAYGTDPLQGVAGHIILIFLYSLLFVFGKFHDNFKRFQRPQAKTCEPQIYGNIYQNM